ncbi:MAG: hypothetical protein JF619_21460 [Massilia sp.]|nr:hypothetical protein [Massilia sp.]
MKTQLFLDLQESGSAPAPPKPPTPASAPPAPPKPPAQATALPRPATPPVARSAADDAAVPRRPPAVWQGPGAQRADMDAAMQRADAGTMQRAPDTAARGLGVAIESWADRAAQSRPAAPAAAPGLPQRDPAIEAQTLSAPAQARDDARPDAHPPVDAGPAARPEPLPDDATIPRSSSAVDEAGWLATRRRAAPTPRKAAGWNRFLPRRLAAWSIAGVLLTGVAAGGLWLYEESRVDGAPVVVAATAPVPAASGARAPAAPQAVAPATTPPVQPVPHVAAAAAVPASPSPVEADRTVKPVDMATPAAADVEPPKHPPRQAVTARKRPAPQTPRARTHDTAPVSRVATEPSARQRREELLMQCRAHGYDERRCFQRACTMTRYGLVCRG